MNNHNKYIIGAITMWGGLGFKRGINSYSSKNENSLYVDKFVLGVRGVIFYLNPFFIPYITYKEMYRLEVNLRGLEDEKKTKFYNEVF